MLFLIQKTMPVMKTLFFSGIVIACLLWIALTNTLLAEYLQKLVRKRKAKAVVFQTKPFELPEIGRILQQSFK